MSDTHQGRPLFDAFPNLRAGFPMANLAELPTPVRRLPKLEARTYATNLWLKDDGPSSAFFGGNKVRKLEFVLADAERAGASAVLTFGYAGSNHAAATAVHGSRIGLRTISLLLPQANAPYVRRNLLVAGAVGAEMHEYSSRLSLAASLLWRMWQDRRSGAPQPFRIPPGGSSPVGVVGFVNAAFELTEQIVDQKIPEPARIYVAAGSLGTAVGLGIGLAAAGLATKVAAVRVVDARYVNRSKMRKLWQQSLALLRAKDPSFPDVGAAEDRIEIRDDFFGGTYAVPTKESAEARRMARRLEGVELDETYSSKALACALADARAGRQSEGPMMLWNTCNTSDLSELESAFQPVDLPARLQRYFELDDSFQEQE